MKRREKQKKRAKNPWRELKRTDFKGRKGKGEVSRGGGGQGLKKEIVEDKEVGGNLTNNRRERERTRKRT